jgi:hypothetical protein
MTIPSAAPRDTSGGQGSDRLQTSTAIATTAVVVVIVTNTTSHQGHGLRRRAATTDVEPVIVNATTRTSNRSSATA